MRTYKNVMSSQPREREGGGDNECVSVFIPAGVFVDNFDI